jgi:hypothetical protein
MVSRSLTTSAIVFFLALLGDPRAALTIPMLGGWTLTQEDSPRPLADSLIRVVVLASVVGAFLVFSSVALDFLQYKSIFQERVGRSAWASGTSIRYVKPGILQLCAFMSFKAGWLLALVPLWLWLARRPFTTLLMLGNLLAIAVLGLFVFDYSRALTFCFPLLMLGAIELDRSARPIAVAIVGTCYMINLITPFYHGITAGLWTLSYPLPVEIVRSLYR